MLSPAEYASRDATALAELVRRREVTADELLNVAIAGVEALNPKLNAVVHRMHDEARACIRAGLPDGPFTGVPFMLKDLQALYAGHPITFGSRLFRDLIPDHDAEIVTRYRQAGLVIMGKTNTPEFGLNATTEPALHGPCRNPWNLERSAGGSSGGSAAAVAAGILPIAHATDGGGSIRIPASACGLFGLKPTRGRNPMGPDIGEGWAGLATGHVVSRSVRDSARVMDATCGPAPGDPYQAAPPARPYAQEVGADPGRLRIGFATRTLDGTPAHAECIAAVNDAARLAASLGHHVEEEAPQVDFASARAAMRTIVAASVQMTIALREEALGRRAKDGEVERITWQAAAEGRTQSAADYARAVLTIHKFGRGMGAFFQRHDLFLTPTLASPPLPLGVLNMNSDDFGPFYEKLIAFIPFTPPFNMAGMPAASLPLHWTPDGLPVGVQFGADFGNEALLFRVSAQFETARPWANRRPPVHVAG